ncbi:hypothetical protein GOB93_08120 [Acetobacter musti]|uniref:Uncharacterized protein n=1 Tax=Acetobacter musti TaxID=864732 RepID=A0ABX0JPZ8_9PROT|nr:hypothetical protein [Acetobacter musti]NHN84610.1 hypothetical protein [Acetobacter musti]
MSDKYRRACQCAGEKHGAQKPGKAVAPVRRRSAGIRVRRPDQAYVSSEPSSELADWLAEPSVVFETTLPEASVTVIVMVPSLFTVSVVVSDEEDDVEEELPADEDELADDVSYRLVRDVPETPEMEEDTN